MEDKLSQALILLTYKSKALLMYRQKNPLDVDNNEWSFIEAKKNAKDTAAAALQKNVEREMGIKIDNVECVSDYYYHATLTDDNVNQIKRAEGQILAFFSRRELQKLILTDPTREFILKHGELI